jgi:predicted ribosome quality control (RQC) complex YloA/Tae2 family protein
MKIETIFIIGLNKNITFYIGRDKMDNFNVIDKGKPNDLWFHAKNNSSCHVVCNVPEDINCHKKKRFLIKVGAMLCKNNTNNLKQIKNLEIIYTEIKNVCKTECEGKVTTLNYKTIKCS